MYGGMSLRKSRRVFIHRTFSVHSSLPIYYYLLFDIKNDYKNRFWSVGVRVSLNQEQNLSTPFVREKKKNTIILFIFSILKFGNSNSFFELQN